MPGRAIRRNREIGTVWVTPINDSVCHGYSAALEPAVLPELKQRFYDSAQQ